MGRLQLNQEALAYVHGLLPVLDSVPDLAAVVLFGSSIDGTFDKRSDIDLVFWFATDRDPERFAMKSVLRVLHQARQTSGVTRDATPVLARLGAHEFDDDFLRNTAKGLVVWAKPRLIITKPADAGPHVLLTYSAKDLDAAAKGRVQRFLHGHTSRKTIAGKTYTSTQPGIAASQWHIAPGTLLLPVEVADPIITGLRDLGAQVTTRAVYTA